METALGCALKCFVTCSEVGAGGILFLAIRYLVEDQPTTTHKG
jgi:hypothetical protein